MAITDRQAIQYSDEVLRPNANRMTIAYYQALAVVDRWAALGGGQEALDVMSGDIEAVAQSVVDAFSGDVGGEYEWIAYGGTSLIPNDPAEDIVDGSPADGRPAVTGADANNVVQRMAEFQNWLLSPVGSFDDATRTSQDFLNTVLAAGQRGVKPMDLPTAQNMVTRCGELQQRYEANSSAELNTLLAYVTLELSA